MWNPDDGPRGGPRGGWGRGGRHFGGPFGGFGGFGGHRHDVTPEQRALFEEARALAHQLMATVGASHGDTATLTSARNALAQARAALASLAAQSAQSSAASGAQGTTPPTQV